MNMLYRQIGYSKQAYHQQERRKKSEEQFESQVKKKVESARKIHPRMGSRRLHKTARIEEMGITRFEEFMSREGLTIRRRRKWIKTTDSRGKHHLYRNLINGIKILNISELVVGDLTYYLHDQNLYYLIFLTDAYSKRIVGFEATQEKSSSYARKVLEQMIQLRGPEIMKGMIHHTDRGSEYRSNEYIGRLKKLEVQISMAKTCLENGLAERINGIIKNDYLQFMDCSTLQRTRKSLEESVYRYNYLGHQEGLNKLTPVEYETWVSSLSPEARPVLQMYDFEKDQKASPLPIRQTGWDEPTAKVSFDNPPDP